MLRSELFEQAVCDDPDNLELRLMFADWCEEQGDSRGEFVRLQLALDSLPEGHLWRFDYLERERELLKEHAGRWNAPLHRRINQTALKGAVRSRRGMVRSWSYRRGFVECLRVEPLAIDLHAELLFSLGPIRHLRIVGLITDWAAGVASCSRMEQLRSLDISCSELDTEGAAVLAGSRYLHQLHTLDVSCSEIGTAGISSFLESPGLDELKTLIAYGMVIPGALAQQARERLGDGFRFNPHAGLDWDELPEAERRSVLSFDEDAYFENGKLFVDGEDSEQTESGVAYDEEWNLDERIFADGTENSEPEDRRFEDRFEFPEEEEGYY